MQASYADVFGIEHPSDGGAEPGDVVRTGPNDWPRFAVIAVDGSFAWLRNVLSGADVIVRRARCFSVAPDEKAT